ncbi:MAG: hypothetical protein KBC35_02210 [Candidatus Pacebacteria bacterium]|nr:hypothetical protein [Candidatus Paceibacterota bacterium]
MSTNDQEYKIAIVGPENMVSGFRALGVESFHAHTAAEALTQLRHIKQQTVDPLSVKRYAVVCIIEDLVALVDQVEYAKIVDGPLPAVVLLPGQTGSSGFALERLRRLAEKAVGASII